MGVEPPGIGETALEFHRLSRCRLRGGQAVNAYDGRNIVNLEGDSLAGGGIIVGGADLHIVSPIIPIRMRNRKRERCIRSYIFQGA